MDAPQMENVRTFSPSASDTDWRAEDNNCCPSAPAPTAQQSDAAGTGHAVPDRAEMLAYIASAFRNAPKRSLVALRCFNDDRQSEPCGYFETRFVPTNSDDGHQELVDQMFEMATRAAAQDRSVVFCAPLATFKAHSATTNDLAAGLTITVECDAQPATARERLTAILGAPSLAIASGGLWANPQTGEIEDKLHLHWVLNEPVLDEMGFTKLRRARKIACQIAEADPSSKSIVHPLRVAGSVHRKNAPRLCRIVDASETLVDLDWALAELERVVNHGSSEPAELAQTASAPASATPASADLLTACAERIPNDSLDWHEWNKFGMAFWRASHGSEEGLAAFALFSRKSPKHDPASVSARWKNYASSPPTDIGLGTLIHHARLADATFEPREGDAEVEIELTGFFGDPELEYEYAIERINKRYFVVVLNGSTGIGTFQKDLTTERERLVLMRRQDFQLKYANQRHLVGHTKGGKEIWKPLGEAWISDPNRRTYDGMTIKPHGAPPRGVLNLWRGWGCKPRQGYCLLISEHIRGVICAGDAAAADYLIRLLAYWVQNPEKLGEVAIVLRGEKGVGKGQFGGLISRIFHHHALQISQGRHLTGNFNSHLADCLFLFVDEAFWGGDKQAEGVLKALVTEPTLMIEPKGVNPFPVANRLKILMASNNDWVVPVTADERRFLVLDVSSHKRKDWSYFKALDAAIKGAEGEAFLHALLNMDLRDFNHRDVPTTKGLNTQKLHGLDGVARWWMDCLLAERILGLDSVEDVFSGWPSSLPKERVWHAYQDHTAGHGDRHPAAMSVFGKRFNAIAPSIRSPRPAVGSNGARSRHYAFNPLEDHRREFADRMNLGSDFEWDEGDA